MLPRRFAARYAPAIAINLLREASLRTYVYLVPSRGYKSEVTSDGLSEYYSDV